MTDPSSKLFAINSASHVNGPAGTPARFFVGLQLDHGERIIRGALLRVLGRGLSADLDVVGTANVADERISLALASLQEPHVAALNESTQAASLAEAAADAVHCLTSGLNPDQGVQLAVALDGFGIWQDDPVGGKRYQARCDTGLLSKLTGLTVIDDIPSRDLAYGGRGGPLLSAGLWMLLADRGAIPGRRIRALIELGDNLRLTLLPPRQSMELPPHLLAHDLAPYRTLQREVTHQLVGENIDDSGGKLAVQGRHRPELLERWRQELGQISHEWTPDGPGVDGLADTFRAWNADQPVSLHDALCTGIHLLADCLATHVRKRLPRSQPIGQMILSGSERHNGLFARELNRRLPETEVVYLDQWSVPNDSLGAAAAAAMGQLHVDQVPGNSPALTGTDVPRILGRLTPGSPASWHQVLASIAETVPMKLPLRSAI